MTAPDRIWLQDAGDYAAASQHGDVTWCVDQIDDADTGYLRADLAAAETARAVQAAYEDAARVADSIALPMDGKREKAQAGYMRDAISSHIRARAAEVAADPPRETRTCPLGEDCDLTVAWMAGAADAKRETADLRAKLGEAVERLRDWQSAGCPYCQGDCASANPPISWCIMAETRATLARITGGSG
jgi:hypothetical protein